MTMPLFKILGPNREAVHGGKGTWPAPGEWLRVEGALVPCMNGLHLCRTSDLVHWACDGGWVWRVEANKRFKVIEQNDKVVVRAARLVEPVGVLTARVLRMFAADCAESVAHLHGHDPRCMEAIRVARLFAHGLASAADRAAAGDAAGAAARDAAWAAAWGAAGDAAGAAARDAQGQNLLALTARYGQAVTR